MRSVVAWSRLFDDQELLVAINTDPENRRGAWVRVEDGLHKAGDLLKFIYANEGQAAKVEARGGRLAVWVEVPAAGVVVLGGINP